MRKLTVFSLFAGAVTALLFFLASGPVWAMGVGASNVECHPTGVCPENLPPDCLEVWTLVDGSYRCVFPQSTLGCLALHPDGTTEPCEEAPSPDPFGESDDLCAQIPQVVLDKTRTVGCGQVEFRGHGPEYWHWQTKLLERENAALRAKIATRDTGGLPLRRAALNAIKLASVVYGTPLADLMRIAECESGVWPLAKNPSSTASGVFQFLDSTWARTPFGRVGFSVFDPYANALAAAWLMDYDRGVLHDDRHSYREWVCQP